MKAIADMTYAEFWIFLAGGQRMLRVVEMSRARRAREGGEPCATEVACARAYQRAMLGYLRSYRTAKALEAREVAEAKQRAVLYSHEEFA